MLVVLRRNLFDELVEVARTKELASIDQTLLNRWTHSTTNLYKRDCNVLVKYRNFVNRAFGYYYEEEEEDEVNLMERQNTTREINEQNLAYQQMEEETRKNNA